MSNNLTPPLAALAFQRISWRQMERKDLRDNLLQAIIEDPEIVQSSNILVNVQSADDTRDIAIALEGTVRSEKEKERAAEIVRVNTADEAEITNKLIVG